MLFPVLGIFINLCLGNLYSWSVFRIPLQKAYGWTAMEATVPFALSIAFFAVAMVIAGRLQDKMGPRTVGMVGGVLVGAGFILSGIMGSTLTGLYIAFGVIGGLGMGCAYVTPLATTIKWWPDKRGLMTGLVVMGFGAGAIIGGIGGPLLIAGVGVMTTFIIFGIAFGAIVTFSAALLRVPPPGYKPAGWSPPAPAPGAKVVKAEYGPGEMVATLPFWLLWIEYVIAAGVGLIVISQASPIGQEVAKLTPVVAGGALTILAVFNGLGRPGFGYISDAIGRKNGMTLIFAMYIASLVFVLPNATTFGAYVVGLCLVGFAFGGTLALMPAFTADFFGTKGLGINYGWLFSAYGVAGGVLTLTAAKVRAVTGAWTTAFWYLAILCAVGLVL
ncbi:MAG TPA: OFA family MFS transporter, partial [Candidatus Methylomirabilis sp.]|nr:OFA family MFS transporter [Candidatus Methylomirabilis sp.]